MKWFDHYVSNTLGGSGNQTAFSTEGRYCTGRVYYKLFAPGKYAYSLLFSNIIDNAADALKNTTEKQLSISLKEDLHGFSFSVSNNGPMIPPQIARSIFDAGVSSHGEGRGMGLYIVRTTIENYGGNITVHSDAAQTTFAGFIPHMKEQNGQQEQKNQSA